MRSGQRQLVCHNLVRLSFLALMSHHQRQMKRGKPLDSDANHVTSHDRLAVLCDSAICFIPAVRCCCSCCCRYRCLSNLPV